MTGRGGREGITSSVLPQWSLSQGWSVLDTYLRSLWLWRTQAGFQQYRKIPVKSAGLIQTREYLLTSENIWTRSVVLVINSVASCK